MMETADHEVLVTCPECEERVEKLIECAVCKKDGCFDCMEECNCGCDKPIHPDCGRVWEMNRYGSKFYWTPQCLLDHAAKLESGAHESIIIAAKARELAK
jgi:hypothetical protein